MTDPITEHDQLMRKMERIAKDLEELEKTPSYQEAVKFKEDIDEVLKKHGKTNEDLLQLLAPPTSTESQKKSSRKPRKPLAKKCFTNPHTGKSIYAKTLKDPELKPWIEEHGPDEVKSWAKKINDKNKPSQQS